MGLSQQKWCSCEGPWGGSRIELWTLVQVGWASILPVLCGGSPRAVLLSVVQVH